MFKLNYPKFWNSKQAILSILLLPLSWLYYLLFNLKFYFNKPIKLPAYAICIGNINVGGTGKTQMVMHIAKYLKIRNIRFCILSKGYSRTTDFTKLVDIAKDNVDIVGDEPFMMAKYFPVIVYKDINLAIKLIKEHNFQIAIFDDGIQNNNFKKDLTILMVDGIRGLGNERLLPSGPLREKLDSGLLKSDLAVIIGNDKYKIAEKIKIPLFNAKIIANSKDEFKDNYIAFAGIGNPDKFFLTLREYGLNYIKNYSFPDHYKYNTKDINKLLNEANKSSCKLITTEKDWVKIPSNLQNKIKYLSVEIKIDEEDKLISLLNEKIVQKFSV